MIKLIYDKNKMYDKVSIPYRVFLTPWLFIVVYLIKVFSEKSSNLLLRVGLNNCRVSTNCVWY